MPVRNESCLHKPSADAQHVLAWLLIHPENLIQGIGFLLWCRMQIERLSRAVSFGNWLLPYP